MQRRDLLKLAGMGLLAPHLGWAEQEPVAGKPPPVLPGGVIWRPIPGLEKDWFTQLHDQKAPVANYAHDFSGMGSPPGKGTDIKRYPKGKEIFGRKLEQLVNSAQHPANSSGQAAAGTLLQMLGKAPDGLSGDALTERLYSTHPPDLLGGTSPDQVARILATNKVNVWSSGAATQSVPGMFGALQDYVRWGYPTALLLDLGPLTDYAWRNQHWVVCYAYDPTNIYATNWDYRYMNNGWSTLMEAWSTPRCAELSCWAVVAW